MAKLLNKTTDQPPLLRVRDDATVQRLEAELAEFTERLTADTARLEQAARDLERAQADLDTTESKLLAGRTDEATFAAAQAKLAECKRAHALALHAREDAARMVALLPAAISEARTAARVRVAAALRARYAERLAELRRLLVAAAEANAALRAAFAEAATEFPTPGVSHPDYPESGWYVIPLGAEAGVTTRAARLADLSFPAIESDGGRNLSVLDLWLREADAVLAALPGMAELDKQQLAQFAAHVPERLARQREQEKLALEDARRNVSLFAHFTH